MKKQKKEREIRRGRDSQAKASKRWLSKPVKEGDETRVRRTRRSRNGDVFNSKRGAACEVGRNRARGRRGNLLQNNKLSAGDFCRRVVRGCFLPEVTSLFLTDDAIIQLLTTYKKMDFPASSCASLGTSNSPSPSLTSSFNTREREREREREATTAHSVWPCYSVQLNA